jgi:hypothetical protein
MMQTRDKRILGDQAQTLLLEIVLVIATEPHGLMISQKANRLCKGCNKLRQQRKE